MSGQSGTHAASCSVDTGVRQPERGAVPLSPSSDGVKRGQLYNSAPLCLYDVHRKNLVIFYITARNAFRILVGKYEGDGLEDRGTGRRIILKWILKWNGRT